MGRRTFIRVGKKGCTKLPLGQSLNYNPRSKFLNMKGILGRKENPRDVKFFSCTKIPKNFYFFFNFFILFTKNVKKYLQERSQNDNQENAWENIQMENVTNKLGRKDPIRERLVTMNPW